VILHEAGRRHSWSGAGPLSIKTFSGGRARYEAGGGTYAVDDGRYLILNEGQPYSVELDARAPVRSFCVFFEPGLVADVQRASSAACEALLDRPDPDDAAAPRFFERTHAHDGVVTPPLAALRRALEVRPEPDALVAPLHALAEALLRAHGLELGRAASVGARRASTREELYRRLHRARDFISASHDQPLDLAAVARVACLSPSHLLRSYRALFGRTPHAELTARRLDEARGLLEAGMGVTQACLAVGFASPTSFAGLFRRRFGRPPGAWRRRG
jgi:AraC-like DNA-binding protein